MPPKLEVKDMELSDAVATLEAFGGRNLTRTLAEIETSLRGVTIDTCPTALSKCGVGGNVLSAAGYIKRFASQINVVIHALGILACLPHLLQPSERVENVSLGAGNTGRAFDLVTNQRIAEFKFIRWQGGPESIRQNTLFKDFYLMAEEPTEKSKFLYVVGTEYPLKFFNSGRSLSSVLSKDVKMQNQFSKKFGESYLTVRDYYSPRKDSVVIQDVSPFVPELLSAGIVSEGLQ